MLLLPTFAIHHLTVAALNVSTDTARRRGDGLTLHQNADLAYVMERTLDGRPVTRLALTNVLPFEFVDVA